MNIMPISVTERTSEIGVRTAVGARKADIRVQFLLEAITLSCIGGVIGILVGALIAFAVRTAIPAIPAFVSPLWIGLGFSISVGVGLFFGYYPANRAANLDRPVTLEDAARAKLVFDAYMRLKANVYAQEPIQKMKSEARQASANAVSYTHLVPPLGFGQ